MRLWKCVSLMRLILVCISSIGHHKMSLRIFWKNSLFLFGKHGALPFFSHSVIKSTTEMTLKVFLKSEEASRRGWSELGEHGSQCETQMWQGRQVLNLESGFICLCCHQCWLKGLITSSDQQVFVEYAMSTIILKC